MVDPVDSRASSEEFFPRGGGGGTNRSCCLAPTRSFLFLPSQWKARGLSGMMPVLAHGSSFRLLLELRVSFGGRAHALCQKIWWSTTGSGGSPGSGACWRWQQTSIGFSNLSPNQAKNTKVERSLSRCHDSECFKVGKCIIGQCIVVKPPFTGSTGGLFAVCGGVPCQARSFSCLHPKRLSTVSRTTLRTTSKVTCFGTGWASSWAREFSLPMGPCGSSTAKLLPTCFPLGSCARAVPSRTATPTGSCHSSDPHVPRHPAAAPWLIFRCA